MKTITKKDIERLTEETIDAMELSKEEMHHIVQLTNSVSTMMESTFFVNQKMIDLHNSGELLVLHPSFIKFYENWNTDYLGLRAYSQKMLSQNKIKVH